MCCITQGILGSSLNNTIHTWALRVKGPVYVAMFKPLSIAIAVAMGVILLGDTLYLGRYPILHIIYFCTQHIYFLLQITHCHHKSNWLLSALTISILGATIIAIGFYTVMWGKAKEMPEYIDSSDVESSPDQKFPLLHNYKNEDISNK